MCPTSATFDVSYLVKVVAQFLYEIHAVLQFDIQVSEGALVRDDAFQQIIHTVLYS